MPRRANTRLPKVQNPEAKAIWQRFEFPAGDWKMSSYINWPARGHTLQKPFCWTPTKPFVFGGRQYVALYPCAAWEGKNFGYVLQKRWDGMTWGRE